MKAIPSQDVAIDSAALERHVLGEFKCHGLTTDIQAYEVDGRIYRNVIALVGAYHDFGDMRRVKGLFKGASTLPATSINAPASVQGVDFSDHASYWRFKMPAIMVTDTAFLGNANYHGAGDTPETLHYARMAQVVRGVFAVAREF